MAQFQNFFVTKLSTDIGAGDTTITLETVPTVPSGRLVLEARNPTQREVIKYTGLAGNQITGVLRGQGNTTAKPHVKNSLVEMNATAEDLQDLYDAFNSFAASTNDWRALLVAPNTVTYNGNRSYDMTFNGVDLTSIISNGMRLRTTRANAAPTHCAALNGTSQYFSKVAPAGMTFTDDFTVSAWVKLGSYTAGVIASRYNGTSGWRFTSNGVGQITLEGYNAGSGNMRYIQSYQSIPLNKWVHVVAQLDMSTWTATTNTNYIMIDGVDAPLSLNSFGTNPTALIQAGDLQIGASNGGSFFPGKIAQVAIFSAKVTQATMRTYVSQGLTGAEPSLISAYALDSLTDLKAVTANNLTANGGALTTTVDSPFAQDDTGTPRATTDFAVVMNKAFSGNTTLTVQVPEGCTIPTLGGVSAVSYSSVETPYGFPPGEDKWSISAIIRTSNWQVTGAVNGTYYPVTGAVLQLPTGSWDVGWSGVICPMRSTGGAVSQLNTLSTSLSVETIGRLNRFVYSLDNTSNKDINTPAEANCPLVTAAMTPLYMLASTIVGSDPNHKIRMYFDQQPLVISANNTYV